MFNIDSTLALPVMRKNRIEILDSVNVDSNQRKVIRQQIMEWPRFYTIIDHSHIQLALAVHQGRP